MMVLRAFLTHWVLYMSWMEGSSQPLILSAVRTTLYSALVRFSYQAVMHPVNMLSIVPLKDLGPQTFSAT